jgi:hypothetical protein
MDNGAVNTKIEINKLFHLGIYVFEVSFVAIGSGLERGLFPAAGLLCQHAPPTLLRDKPGPGSIK